MLPCVVTGLKLAARAFTKPGDAIVLMPPVYGPFRQSIVCNHRKPAAAPLVSDAQGRYSMDYAAIEAQLKAGSRCVFLCNPHNPVSRAWSREELQRLLMRVTGWDAVETYMYMSVQSDVEVNQGCEPCEVDVSLRIGTPKLPQFPVLIPQP